MAMLELHAANGLPSTASLLSPYRRLKSGYERSACIYARPSFIFPYSLVL